MKHLLSFLMTLAIVAGVSVAHAKTTTVSPGSGLKSAIDNAAAGDELLLSTGNYSISSTVTVNKKLTIKAATSASPVLNLSRGFAVTADFSLQGLAVNATGVSEIIRCKAGTSKFSVTIDNCIFQAATGIFFKAKEDNGTDPKDYINQITVTNSTFYRPSSSASEDRMFYIGNESGSVGPAVTINHCTFYGGYSERGIYLANIDGAQVLNSIFMAAGQGEKAQKSFCLYGATCLLSHSLSFNAELYLHDGTQSVASGVFNPYFVDVQNANFQLFKNSPAVGKATDGGNIGDPRWGVSTQDFDISTLPLEDFIVKYPYSMAPTTSSVRILWELNNGDSLGVVHYGTSADNLNLTASSKDGIAIDSEGFVHVVTLTGLQPFTTYYYKVGNNTRTLDHLGSTRTAPNPGTACRIFTISDIHVNARNNWSNMQDFICTLDADLMMCNGDFVNNGNGRDWNDALFNPGKPFLSQTPMMSAPGNHETGDPDGYRYSTFYDYFWQFSHGYIDGDSIKDPRGESYFSFDYGNAKMIAVNVNGDESSPSHLKNSQQINWVDSQIENAVQDWILVFGHVGLTTSGYHGQWPPEGRDAWRAMFEKHAAQGKHIIYFCGDDHSFEHAYKDGVHYVRPGCGRDANYAQVTSLNDAQYTLFYKKVSCYSTLDMSADGSQIIMTSRDSASNVFYTYTFKKTNEEMAPNLHFLSPATDVKTADSTRIQWFAFNPTGDAKIALYYTDTNQPANGTLIVDNLSAATNAKRYYYWQTRSITDKKKYYIYGTIATPDTTVYVMASGSVTLEADTTAPGAPRLTGDIRNGQYFLAWENPTHPMLVQSVLQDFENDMSGFATTNDEEGYATISRVAGRDGGQAMQVDYTGLKEWGEGSVYYTFPTPRNLSQTPALSFWMKGNGKSSDLRLFVKCDADFDGKEDDWWYSEAFNLSNTNWKQYTIDLSTFVGLDWHTNISDKPELSSVTSIWFTIPTPSAGSGTFYLDDVAVEGVVNAAPDYAGTVIVRNSDHFPANSTDGDQVYNGTAETCYDASADIAQVYYYAAFAYDDLNNMSAPDPLAQWLSSDLNPSARLNTVFSAPSARKFFHHGHCYIHTNNRTFTILGESVNR